MLVLSDAARAELRWWYQCIDLWNGKQIMVKPVEKHDNRYFTFRMGSNTERLSTSGIRTMGLDDKPGLLKH